MVEWSHRRQYQTQIVAISLTSLRSAPRLTQKDALAEKGSSV